MRGGYKVVEILIGLPGSGKSTYSREFKEKGEENLLILSADEIRDNIIDKMSIEDKEQILENKTLVNPFNILYEKFAEGLSNGIKHIIIDATNLTKKTRKQIFEYVSQYGEGEYIVKATVFYENIFTLYERVYLRNTEYKNLENNGNEKIKYYVHRKIDRNIINRMLLHWDIPTYEEGFFDIEILNGAIGLDYKVKDSIYEEISLFEESQLLSIIESNELETPQLKGIHNFINYVLYFYNLSSNELEELLTKEDEKEIQKLFKEMLNTHYYLIYYLGFEQTSKWHKETLEEHIYLIFRNALKQLISYKRNIENEIGELNINIILERLFNKLEGFDSVKNNGLYPNSQLNIYDLEDNFKSYYNRKGEEKYYMNSFQEYLEYFILIFFHDIGKLFTRKTKFENLLGKGYKEVNGVLINKKGKILKNGLNDYQFLGHDKVSALIFNYEIIPLLQIILGENLSDSDYNSIYKNIKNHIKYHDFINGNMKNCDIINKNALTYSFNPVIGMDFEYLDSVSKIS